MKWHPAFLDFPIWKDKLLRFLLYALVPSHMPGRVNMSAITMMVEALKTLSFLL